MIQHSQHPQIHLFCIKQMPDEEIRFPTPLRAIRVPYFPFAQVGQGPGVRTVRGLRGICVIQERLEVESGPQIKRFSSSKIKLNQFYCD